jgi:hypothetical protein
VSFSLTLARPVLPTLNDRRATVLARRPPMRPLSVALPLVPRSPFTSMVTTPLLLTLTRRMRGLPGLAGCGSGFGSASAESMAPVASTTPPVAVTPAMPATGLAPFFSAWTT